MQGVVDENTLVWGQGLADWLPIRNVRTLVPQIRTVEGESSAAPMQPCLVCRSTILYAHGKPSSSSATLWVLLQCK